MKTNTIVKAVAGVFVIGGGLGYFTRLPGLFLSGYAISAVIAWGFGGIRPNRGGRAS